MQEYHQNRQKSPIDAQARIMASLQSRKPRKSRAPRFSYGLLFLGLTMLVPTGGFAINSTGISGGPVQDRQHGSRSESTTQTSAHACTCSSASPPQTLYRLPDLSKGTTARWQRVVPDSVLSRIGTGPMKRNPRCLSADTDACVSNPKLPQTLAPRVDWNGQQSVQFQTPFDS